MSALPPPPLPPRRMRSSARPAARPAHPRREPSVRSTPTSAHYQIQKKKIDTHPYFLVPPRTSTTPGQATPSTATAPTTDRNGRSPTPAPKTTFSSSLPPSGPASCSQPPDRKRSASSQRTRTSTRSQMRPCWTRCSMSKSRGLESVKMIKDGGAGHHIRVDS